MLRRVMSSANRNIAVTSFRFSPNQIQELEAKLTDNPYFLKFKDRIQKLKETDPDTYIKRLELMLDQQAANEKAAKAAEKSVDELTSDQSKAAAAQPSYVAPKTLDSVMKVERLKNKDAKEIEQIWKKFHMHRSAVFACMSAQYWNFFAAIKMHLPVFVYPVPRDDNQWLFYVGQWGGNELNFTTLEHFKLKGADAPVILTLCHYPDLIESKGVCLMVGDVDENMISRVDAQMLASQAQYFHTEPQGMNLIQTFNTAPQNFKYDDVIKCVETIGQ